MNYNFEWDPQKAKINWGKHRVSFELAGTVFKDPKAISIFDSDYNEKEERWITLGLAANGLLLVVHHTFEYIEKESSSIRIISSRKTTKKERLQYEENF